MRNITLYGRPCTGDTIPFAIFLGLARMGLLCEYIHLTCQGSPSAYRGEGWSSWLFVKRHSLNPVSSLLCGGFSGDDVRLPPLLSFPTSRYLAILKFNTILVPCLHYLFIDGHSRHLPLGIKGAVLPLNLVRRLSFQCDCSTGTAQGVSAPHPKYCGLLSMSM